MEEDQFASRCVFFRPGRVIPNSFYRPVRVLGHLHSQSIIHRDITSDNVLLDALGCIKTSISSFPTVYTDRLRSGLWILR
jgi:serine/threonine protein kinase